MKAGVGRLGYRGAAWLAIAAWLCMACGGSDDAAPEPSETARPGGTAATGTTRATTAPVTSTSTTAAPSPTPGEPAAATTTPAATTAGAANTPAPTSTAAAPTPPVPTATPPPRPSTVSVVIHAQSLAFDVAVVRVPAGARVTATLQNDDPGVEHNLTFGVPGLAHGPTCSGPCTRTQTFTAPAAGSYFFLCTLHDMFGDLIVDP